MIQRPTTLAQVAERAESQEDFGRLLRDWLHELRRASSRPQVTAAIAETPRPLRNLFTGGPAADAWLAAYAEHLALQAGTPPPKWAFARARIAPEPWFAEAAGSPALRFAALRQTPLPFKRRNLYTRAVELSLGLRPGRPAKSATENQLANRERQQRFRERRKAELIELRTLAGASDSPRPAHRHSWRG